MKKQNPFKVGDVEVLIDKKSLQWVKLFHWKINKKGNTCYAASDLPRFFGRKAITMHGLIMYVVNGHRQSLKKEIDHIDGNGLNNKISNLRFATSSENKCNRKKDHGKYKYKGYYFVKGSNKFAVVVRLNNQKHHIGLYKSEIEAAKAYDKAASRIHGEFAMLNFPVRYTLAEEELRK